MNFFIKYDQIRFKAWIQYIEKLEHEELVFNDLQVFSFRFDDNYLWSLNFDWLLLDVIQLFKTIHHRLFLWSFLWLILYQYNVSNLFDWFVFCIDKLNDVLVAHFLDSVLQNDVFKIVILNLLLIFSYVRFNSVFSLYSIQRHVDEQNFNVVDSVIQIDWFYCDDHIPLSLYDVISFFELRKASNVFFCQSCQLLTDDDSKRFVLLILSDFDVFENRNFNELLKIFSLLFNTSFRFKMMRRSIESIKY